MNEDLTITEAMRKVTVAMKKYVDDNFQPKIDDALLTTNKTVVGAINEILNKGTAVSEKEVFNANTHLEFPALGNVNYIYKAYEEKKTYQWNDERQIYEALDEDVFDIESVEIIHGGNADGTN